MRRAQVSALRAPNMPDDFPVSRSTQSVSRTEVRGRHGAVAAKHELAAEVGIDVLREGGGAVDAAVAMAFTLGVVEPYMSGLGGGGFMVVAEATGATRVIDFAVVAPRHAAPEMFELAGGVTGFFAWPAVVGDANITGHRAVGVPGAVAGLLESHRLYGMLPLSRLLDPAIGFARDGFEADTFTSFMIGQSVAELRRFPASVDVFLPEGRPPIPRSSQPGERVLQRDLAQTLELIGRHGADVFYRGELAAAIAEEMARHDGILERHDLATYRPRVHAPGLVGEYRGCRLVGVPAPSGGPTVLETLALLQRFDVAALGAVGADGLHLLIEAETQAFADRFQYLSDASGTDDQEGGDAVAQLLSPSHLDAAAARIKPRGARAIPPARAVAHEDSERTTTTLAVCDGEGTMVTLTTTLLSSFGSSVTVPGTGILLNNGMMWFDPRPGRPNSVGPGKRPLNNMSPLVVLREGRPWLAVGAMGGRRIIGAAAAIVRNAVDFGMGMQEACAAPRPDVSTGEVLIDPRVPPEVIAALRERGHDLRICDDTLGAFEYGSPACIMRDDSGLLTTGVDPLNPAAAMAF